MRALGLFLPGVVLAATVDGSFNPSLNDSVMTMALQADGRPVIGGRFTEVNGISRPYLARLRSDGTLDAAFAPTEPPAQIVYQVVISGDRIFVAAADGIRRYDFEGNLDWHYPLSVSALAVDTNGRVLFGGTFTRVEGQYHRSLARLTADGQLDATFNSEVGCCAGDAVHAIHVAHNAIFVGGRFQSVNSVAAGNLAKLHPDGALDESFAATADPLVLSLAALPDGRLFRASEHTLRRHLSDGSVDESFAAAEAGFNITDRFVAIALQPDGKPIVGGSFTFGGGPDTMHVARFNTDGSLDSSFAIEPNDFVQAIAIQSDGTVLLGGAFTRVNGLERTGLVRVTGELPVLKTFRTESGAMAVSWPAHYTEHVLESSKVGLDDWSRVTNPLVVVTGDRNVVTNSVAGSGRLFRLALP